MTASIFVVELGLGYRIIDVDGRKEQLAAPCQLDQAVHASGGLLGDTLDPIGDRRPSLTVFGQTPGQDTQYHAVLFRVGGRRIGYRAGLLEFHSLVDQESGIAAIIEDHGRPITRPTQGLLCAPPVLLECLAFPSEDRHAPWIVNGAIGSDGHRGSGMVLGGEDVATGPAHFCSERSQRLDEYRRLDGHVERAGNTGTCLLYTSPSPRD